MFISLTYYCLREQNDDDDDDKRGVVGQLPVERRSQCDEQSVDWRFQSRVSTSPSRHAAETVVSSRARQSRR